MGGAIRLVMLAVLLSLCCSVSARVVINEVCYDPEGQDGGGEWIELYNSGDIDADLDGALILSGGSGFNSIYEIPPYVLRSHRFLLIGESSVTAAVFTAELDFQNGGAETDGIRFVSADGLYTDTVLYDSPNLNGLPDDNGVPGSSLAPDTPDGASLARLCDGFDTNACALDWQIETIPTPGLPNRAYPDFALLHPQLAYNSDTWLFSLWVKNLSPFVPEAAAELSVLLDGVQIGSQSFAGLASGDSLLYEITLPVEDELNHLVEASLDLSGDPDISNNSLSLSLLQEDLDVPRINELMYDPQPGHQEWIEVYLGYPPRGDYLLRDSSGNQFSFALPPHAGYYVLCGSAEDLLTDYPSCPAASVVEVGSWAILNNNGDALSLCSTEGSVLDQMSYTGVDYQRGVSLERYPAEDSFLWRPCLDPAGATPGLANSQSAPIPQFSGALKLTGSPCQPSSGQGINLFYDLDRESSRVNCRIYDRAGRRIRVLADNLSVPEQGSLFWDGRDSGGSVVPRGLYIISWESQSSPGGKIMRRQLTAVIY